MILTGRGTKVMSNRKIKKDRQKKSVLSRLIRFISDIIKDWKNDGYKQIRDSFGFDLVLTAIAIINDDLKIKVTVLVIAILLTFLIPRLTGPLYSWWYSKRPEGIIIESKSQELTLTEKGGSEVYGHMHNEYMINSSPDRRLNFPFHVIVGDFNKTGLKDIMIKVNDKDRTKDVTTTRERITRGEKSVYDYIYSVPITFEGYGCPVLKVDYDTYEFGNIMNQESLTMNIRDPTEMMIMTVILDEELRKKYKLRMKSEVGKPYWIKSKDGRVDWDAMKALKERPVLIEDYKLEWNIYSPKKDRRYTLHFRIEKNPTRTKKRKRR